MRKKTGFTLVELLVVISIIALLAAILMPNLMDAKESANRASCLNNLHNAGLSIMMYVNENGGYYPTAYSYIDGNASTGGYQHWTSTVHPSDFTALPTDGKYARTSPNYVCPSHSVGGWAPTNFTTTRIPVAPAGQVAQTNTLDDKQVARLSYVANEILMPRKKYSTAHDIATPPGTSNLCLVSSTEVEGIQNTILLGEFSQSSNCIYGASSGGGATYKSHRPTNGVKGAAGAVFDGENYTTGAAWYKLTAAEAQTAIDAVLADKTAAATNHHISYVEANMHKTGSNYTFADGHAAKFMLKDTFDPNNYMWGRKIYSCVDKPVIQDNP
jgi:prepilin-type N-terminal cleavage/methylation domain-containing protein/prepilin-type processing-associated H-X9-DG protein